jgi:hypothetical protein
MGDTLLKLGIGTAATLATGGAAAPTLLGSATLFSAVSAIPTILSIGSAFSSIAGGSQGAAVSKAQSRQAELTAKQEELRGRESAARIRSSLASSLASQNAIFGARGIGFSGTPQVLSNESTAQASRDISIAQFGAAQSAGAQRSQAQQFQIEGQAKRTAGFIDAGKSLYSLVK